MLSINLFGIIPPEKRTSRMDEYSKNEILFSEAIGVCRVADILNLSSNKKDYIRYYLLISLHDSNKSSYIPVNSHHVLLRSLITVEEAHNRENAEYLSMQEKQEIEYVLQKDRKEQTDA